MAGDAALLDYLITGRRNGQSATANNGQYVGLSHRLPQVICEQLVIGNELLREGNETLAAILNALAPPPTAS